MRPIMCLAVLFFAACSKDPNVANDGTKQVPRVAYQLVDRFNVGRSVVVRAMAIDSPRQQLWVGTSVGALLIDMQNQKVLKRFTRANGLANEYIFSVMVGSKQNVWFGTNGGGVSRLDKNDQWKTYFPMHGLADYWVYSFAQRRNGEIWIGTWNGISVLKQDKFTTYLKELVNEWIYGLAIDSKDQVWIGTEGGVNMYDGKQWHVWNHKDGVGSKNAHALSPSDNTGLGTRDRHNLTTLVNGKQTYNPNYIFSVVVDQLDRVWVGTWGGGVSVFTGKVWQNYSEKQGLKGGIVYSLAYDKTQNRLWAGTNKGLYYLHDNKWQEIMGDQHIYAVQVDSKRDQVWAGGHEAVLRFARVNRAGEAK